MGRPRPAGTMLCMSETSSPDVDWAAVDRALWDAKTRLQEHLQGRGNPLPQYELLSVEGEGHAQQFTVCCRVGNPDVSAQGQGSSRRRAEQAAAGKILRELDADGR